MSIRALALDLYKTKQRLDELEKECKQASAKTEPGLTQELNAVKKEFEMLRRMLDGEKESGSFRKRFDGFGNKKR